MLKRDFFRIIKEASEMAFSMANIKSGFKRCGIFRFNPNTVGRCSDLKCIRVKVQKHRVLHWARVVPSKKQVKV